MKFKMLLAVVALASVTVFSAPAPAVGPMKKDDLRGGELICQDVIQKIQPQQERDTHERKAREIANAVQAN